MSKESLGVINWWGFSPAIDFLGHGNGVACNSSIVDLCSDVLHINQSLGDINILLVGCGDCRHVLRTISGLYGRQCGNINFYVLENGIELYARQMLQMIIALIPLSRIGLQDKTELFLELYGNGLVRQQSMDFVRAVSNELIRLVTDLDQCSSTLPFLDLSLLKFKERDILEAVFKIWKDTTTNARSFDMCLCWDLRVRHNLGPRYDAIPNVFDWDCSMVLHDRGAAIVNSREYSHWRHRGVAFQLRDTNYDVSNRTLSSGRVLQTAGGDSTVRLGYWGDIVCSPYLAFGIASSNEALFKKSNNQHTCGASRVSEYNVSEIFYQLAHKKRYVENVDGATRGPTITEVDDESEEAADSGDVPYVNDLLPLPTIKIAFLPVNALAEALLRKAKFRQLFDMVYFSASLAGQMESGSDSLRAVLRPGATVMVETPHFMVNVSSDQNQRYLERVEEMARAAGLAPVTSKPQSAASASSNATRPAHVIYKPI